MIKNMGNKTVTENYKEKDKKTRDHNDIIKKYLELKKKVK